MREAPARRCLGELDPNAVRVPGDLRKPPGPASARASTKKRRRTGNKPPADDVGVRVVEEAEPRDARGVVEASADAARAPHRRVAEPRPSVGPTETLAVRALLRELRGIEDREGAQAVLSAVLVAFAAVKARSNARDHDAEREGSEPPPPADDDGLTGRTAPLPRVALQPPPMTGDCTGAAAPSSAPSDFFSDLDDDDDDDDDDVPFVEDYAALARERRETESARARPEDASTPRAAAAAPRQDTSASIGADAYARTAGASPAESLDGVAWLAPLHCSADSGADDAACAFDETEPAADAARDGALKLVCSAPALDDAAAARDARARGFLGVSRAAYRTGFVLFDSFFCGCAVVDPDYDSADQHYLRFHESFGEPVLPDPVKPYDAVVAQLKGLQAARVPPSVADIEAHITEWREAIIMLDQAGEESDDGDDDYTMCSCGSMPPLSAPRFDSRAWSRQRSARRAHSAPPTPSASLERASPVILELLS